MKLFQSVAHHLHHQLLVHCNPELGAYSLAIDYSAISCPIILYSLFFISLFSHPGHLSRLCFRQPILICTIIILVVCMCIVRLCKLQLRRRWYLLQQYSCFDMYFALRWYLSTVLLLYANNHVNLIINIRRSETRYVLFIEHIYFVFI